MSTINWKQYRDTILATVDNTTFFTDEFTDLNLKYSQHGYEIKSQCPFKELHAGGDKNPSFTLNVDRGVYFCNSCGSKGNIHTFVRYKYNLSKTDAWYMLGDALGIERPTGNNDERPGIDPSLPAKYHKAFKELNKENIIHSIMGSKRGLTKATLERFMIGWDGERVTIPIYDEFNELVNIRRYQWNSQDDNYKMINFKDVLGNTYGETRLFGIENLFRDDLEEIIICEGEWDRLILEQNGYVAVTATSGANSVGAIRHEWIEAVKRAKVVRLCGDNDRAGNDMMDMWQSLLQNAVKLKKIKWPENFKDRCDPTDFFTEYKGTPATFDKLFIDLDSSETVPVVSLAASSNAKYTGKRLRIPVLVAGKETSPYIFPSKVRLSCSVYGEENKLCATCSLYGGMKRDLQFTSASNAILTLIGCPSNIQMGILRSMAGANTKCKYGDMDIVQYGNLEAIHMIPKADVGFGFAKQQEYVQRTGYMIGDALPTNRRYSIVGYMHPDPETQRATYVFDEAMPEKGLLDELEITPEVYEKLKIFQPSENQTVASKFKEIHADLERNITYIWERRKVAYATDLVYHSVISFYFQEQLVKRGWVECLVIGDSGQAKTTLIERLMVHYRAGELLSGESSKRTGLVYNLQQSGSRGNWSLMWGAMPINDGGLVTIDELSGMSEDDLAKMSDVRSSGIAKVSGVITAETTARTRMIFISNPRNGRQLKAENYGVSAVLKLWGKAEDVRRLDFAVGVASGEVDPDIVNKSISDMPPIPHVYTSDLCNLRVMWAWSRRPENVSFDDDAAELILREASRMGKQYTSRIPLVEPADQRLKIARLSISAAICMFSTEDGENVIVKKEHVQFVVDFLNEQYNSKALGYDRFSMDDFENSDTTDASMTRLRKEFISIPFIEAEVSDVVKALYQLVYFNRNTLEDYTGLDRDELRDLLKFLTANSIIEKAGPDYKRTPMGLAFCEYMLINPADIDEVRRARQEAATKFGGRI